MDAKFVHGNPVMVDHTPSSAVSGGDVVVVADLALVAHRDIAASEQGALAAGGGVYECTADAAIDEGDKVYWDDTNDLVTETSTGNKVFGYIVDGTSAASSGVKVNVLHKPEAD